MTTGSAVVLHLLEGPEDAPVIVLSNSLGTPHAMWDEQAPALSERFCLLRYDHLGHGGSPAPPDRAELIRDSIPDAAHLANIEQPEAVTQAILDHLSQVVREGR